MTTIGTQCIVHNRKYLSKFHGTINQLRRTNQFSISTLQQLSKRCCSCRGQVGESSFDLDHLRKLCHQIQPLEETPPIISDPVKPIHYIILEFPLILNLKQRMYKAGRFVGRGGQHLRLLERTLNIRIHIVNNKSSKRFRRIVNQHETRKKRNHRNHLSVLFTIQNNNDRIEQIKQSLQDQWKKVDVGIRKKPLVVVGIRKKPLVVVGIRKKPLATIPLNEPPVISSTGISGDTRWKPKTQGRTDKHQKKQKQYIEQEEVRPQPQFRLISMPKAIATSQKINRR